MLILNIIYYRIFQFNNKQFKIQIQSETFVNFEVQLERKTVRYKKIHELACATSVNMIFKWHDHQVTWSSGNMIFRWHDHQATWSSGDMIIRWHHQVTWSSGDMKIRLSYHLMFSWLGHSVVQWVDKRQSHQLNEQVKSWSVINPPCDEIHSWSVVDPPGDEVHRGPVTQVLAAVVSDTPVVCGGWVLVTAHVIAANQSKQW